jgi:uncharacterized protein YmfQ (DUF2313 family)
VLDLPQALPSEESISGDFARALLRWLGPAYQAPDGSPTAAHFLALGDALATVYNRQTAVLEEAFPETAASTLSYWEARLGLAVDPLATVATRRARLLAKRRATGSNTFAGLTAALAAIDPLVKVTATSASSVTHSPRSVYRVAVRLSDEVYDDAAARALVLQICRQMLPPWCEPSIGVKNFAFLCDDPDSLCDRHLLSE